MSTKSYDLEDVLIRIEKLKRHIHTRRVKQSPIDYISKVSILYNLLIESESLEEADEYAKELIAYCTRAVFLKLKEKGDFPQGYDLFRKAYFYLASRCYFHYFLIALEMDRPPEEKFYQPRMKQLRVAVDALQDLYDRKLEFLSIEMPPRVGKSTLGLFFLTMCVGKNPNRSSLAVSYATSVVSSFYDGIKEIIDDESYNFRHIFPHCNLVDQSAKELFLDYNKRNRYKSITFRSIDGQLTGVLEANDILYLDDLIQNIEEAKSAGRLEKAWDKVRTDIFQRRKPSQGCVTLAIGTNWSEGDPLSMLKNLYADNPRALFIVIPALDDNDESNFDYDYGLGFDSKYYKSLRDEVYVDDPVTFSCVYQQQTMERVERTFTDLKYFYDLPKDKKPIVLSNTDVAFGGGDDLAMPIGYLYGKDMYVVDFLVNSASYEKTEPMVVKKIVTHQIHKAVFEANNGGDFYARDIKTIINKKYKTLKTIIRADRSSTAISKYERIEQYSPDILNMYFRHPDTVAPYSDYDKAMKLLNRFSIKGNPKRQKDDVPDSLAGLAKLARESHRRRGIKTINREDVGGIL